MDKDPSGRQGDLGQALTVVVEVDPIGKRATLTFGSVDGALDDASCEFEDFPTGDFFGDGLNVIGPWLNRRGLAYNTWQKLDANRYTAVVYRYDAPETGPRISRQ